VCQEDTSAWSRDERKILALIKERLDQGRDLYGPWRVADEREYPNEALEEVLDALAYIAAELLRYRGGRYRKQVRREFVYQAHRTLDTAWWALDAAHKGSPDALEKAVRRFDAQVNRLGCCEI